MDPKILRSGLVLDQSPAPAQSGAHEHIRWYAERLDQDDNFFRICLEGGDFDIENSRGPSLTKRQILVLVILGPRLGTFPPFFWGPRCGHSDKLPKVAPQSSARLRRGTQYSRHSSSREGNVLAPSIVIYHLRGDELFDN